MDTATSLPDPHDALAAVDAKTDGFRADVGLILGSGLGAVADAVEDAIKIPYGEIPGFAASTVVGHSGTLVLGKLQGKRVAVMQGRMHLYEGHPPQVIQTPVRLLNLLGCETLFVTNAAGSLHQGMGPGSLMQITDHINFLNCNPLTGANDNRFGPRFSDMTEAYSMDLRQQVKTAAEGLGIALDEGVYLATPGPSFETPAEIRAFQALGADAVGMSTVPEVIVARHCGMGVAAVSVITNLAAGLSGEALSHEETLENGQLAAANLTKVIGAFLAAL